MTGFLSIKQNAGSTVALQWQQQLSEADLRRCTSQFSLIIWEKERKPFTNEWRALSVTRLPNKRMVNIDERFFVVENSSLVLHNATSSDSTRYRCTFFSSVTSRQSYIFLLVTGLSCCFYC